MRPLRNLLATWENWSAREVSRRALANAQTEAQREVITMALDQGADVDPLAVLQDTAELVSLLDGWRWQVMGAAHEAGCSWARIGAAAGTTAEQAEAEYIDVVERQTRRHPGGASSTGTVAAVTADGDQERLAIYGTLGPGGPNHYRLSHLAGSWTTGAVRGRLLEDGWGAAMGYPGMVLDPDGDSIPVHLLTSADLPKQWSWLDEFEGSGYRRVTASVQTDGGDVLAHLYVLRAGRDTT